MNDSSDYPSASGRWKLCSIKLGTWYQFSNLSFHNVFVNMSLVFSSVQLKRFPSTKMLQVSNQEAEARRQICTSCSLNIPSAKTCKKRAGWVFQDVYRRPLSAIEAALRCVAVKRNMRCFLCRRH